MGRRIASPTYFQAPAASLKSAETARPPRRPKLCFGEAQTATALPWLFALVAETFDLCDRRGVLAWIRASHPPEVREAVNP